jgi:hypothetical protein
MRHANTPWRYEAAGAGHPSFVGLQRKRQVAQSSEILFTEISVFAPGGASPYQRGRFERTPTIARSAATAVR